MTGESLALLRLYSSEECGPRGYPVPWESGKPRIPDLVRELAGHRCVRCQHPFICGETPGEWSPCDDRCTHDTREVRWLNRMGDWTTAPINIEPNAAQEARYRVLTVHHLTGEKADCRWWNLAALCQRCHLEIQGRVRMERIYILEHSEWFKPYAAGYYAWTYLGEDLSREQVVERQDELLALEASPA